MLDRLTPASGEPSPPGWSRLNTNELAVEPPPEVVEAIASAARGINRYPDPRGGRLRDEIARHHGVAAENILVSAGADGALDACFRAFCDPGMGVAFLDPSYPYLSNLAEIFTASVSLAQSPATLLALNSRDTALTIIVNPNSPTGTWVRPNELIAAASCRGLIVLDEAYVAYAPQGAIDLLRDAPNWLVVRSFSKSHGLAGIRLGYAVGDADVIATLSSTQDPYPVSNIAIEAGLAALKCDQYYTDIIETIVEERRRVTERLRAIGWKVADSHANFVFAVPPDETVGPYVERLRSHRILVRVFSRAAHGIRISVGSPAENEALLDALVSVT